MIQYKGGFKIRYFSIENSFTRHFVRYLLGFADNEYYEYVR